MVQNKLLKWSLESFRDVVKAHLALEHGGTELGDALFCTDKDAQNKVFVGVASQGIGCAKSGADFPAGLYSRIWSQWEWIKSMICKFHSNPNPHFCGNAATAFNFFENRSEWNSNLRQGVKHADTTNVNRIWLYHCGR